MNGWFTQSLTDGSHSVSHRFLCNIRHRRSGPFKEAWRCGDQPRDELGCSEAGYIAIIMGSPERRHQHSSSFSWVIPGTQRPLSDGAVVTLVEGKRDAAALVELGYTGGVVTSSTVKSGSPVVRRALFYRRTDRPRHQGRRLAARYIKLFSRMGIQTTLAPRGRLSRGSHGKFLHIENLIRFAPLPL